MTPRPWRAEPMWERTQTPWWKVVGPKGQVVLVSVTKTDALAVCDAINALNVALRS